MAGCFAFATGTVLTAVRVDNMLPLQHPLAHDVSAAATAVDAGFESLWPPDQLLGVYPPVRLQQVAKSKIPPDPDVWFGAKSLACCEFSFWSRAQRDRSQ